MGPGWIDNAENDVSVTDTMESRDRPSERGRARARSDALLLEQLGLRQAAPGERMRALRRARGLTQDELARATGVSRSAVAQWETGRAGFSNRIARVAVALGVSPRELRLVVPQHDHDTDRAEISRDEATLLGYFRDLASADRACLLLLARRLALASGA
jgi:transcriptional regulator with XRE-family HTH domain